MDCMSYNLVRRCGWWGRVSIHTLHIPLSKMGQGQTSFYALCLVCGLLTPVLQGRREVRLGGQLAEAWRVAEATCLTLKVAFVVSCWRQRLCGSQFMQALLTIDGGIPQRALWEGWRNRKKGMKMGAGEATSVQWGEGRTRKFRVERK